MRTIAYTRVSTERQTEGNGIEQQRNAIAAWAAATGCTINDWASDAETGMSVDREEIQRLLTAAKAKDFQRLVVDRLDRLGRTVLVIEGLFQEFRAAGVDVLCVNHAIESTPSGSMIRHVMSAVAEYQRSEWLARMKTCKRVAVARKGTYGGGGCPYGYMAVGDGKLVIDERTADLVRRCFALKAQGLSLSGVTRALDSEGFKTRKGTALSVMQISRIIKRKDVYAGMSPVQHVQLEAGVTAQQPEIITRTHGNTT